QCPGRSARQHLRSPWRSPECLSLLAAIRQLLKPDGQPVRGRLLVVSLAVILAVVACGVWPWLRDESQFRKAAQALDRDAFAEADAHLAACLEFNPQSARAHFLSAQLARRREQFARAEKELQVTKELGWP